MVFRLEWQWSIWEVHAEPLGLRLGSTAIDYQELSLANGLPLHTTDCLELSSANRLHLHTIDCLELSQPMDYVYME